MLPLFSSTWCFGSMWSAFATSNLNGQVIVIILVVGSVFTWSLMLTKFTQLSQAKKASQLFLQSYRKEKNPSAVFLRRQRFPSSPLYVVYEATCRALGAEAQAKGADPGDLFMGGMGNTQVTITQKQMDAVQNVTDRTVADQVLHLESLMTYLALSTAVAPLLGLLGTVWGVMDSFGAMAEFGSAMLSAVAPGISGALLTTVVGLLVAMPSTIAYNLLADRIRHLSAKMDHFASELLADIDRTYSA